MCGQSIHMLIPRGATKCFEAVLETIEPGIVTPPNAHENFAQMFFIVSGRARAWVGDESKDTSGPAVAYIPQKTNHYVKNIGDEKPRYIYVSIWPGTIPESDGREWHRSVEDMVKMYASRAYPAQRDGHGESKSWAPTVSAFASLGHCVPFLNCRKPAG